MVVSTRPEGVSTARQWVCSGPRRRAPARRHPGHILAITNNHGAVAVAGPGPEALLLGVFQVSVLHKVVRFLFAPRGFHGRHLPAGAEFPAYCGQLAAPRPGPGDNRAGDPRVPASDGQGPAGA